MSPSVSKFSSFLLHKNSKIVKKGLALLTTFLKSASKPPELTALNVARIYSRS